MPPTGFKPTIPASEQPQTHALDRVATGIGRMYNCQHLYTGSKRVTHKNIQGFYKEQI
jgi:hypothetical protein